MSNVALALAHLVVVYADNAPEDSASGSERGLGRRQGRRDCAVSTLAVLMGVSRVHAREALEQLAKIDVCRD